MPNELGSIWTYFFTIPDALFAVNVDAKMNSRPTTAFEICINIVANAQCEWPQLIDSEWAHMDLLAISIVLMKISQFHKPCR